MHNYKVQLNDFSGNKKETITLLKIYDYRKGGSGIVIEIGL